MCGFVGVVTGAGRPVGLTDSAAAAWRDGLAHRGPDGAGLWRAENALLAHRRLAVRGLGPAADQPMVSADGRRALAYNGELYADAELRAELEDDVAREGGFRTACDTETLFHLLRRDGAGATRDLRGMFAFAWVDLDAGELLLARDPLGVKPLYWTIAGASLVFGSEVRAVLAHPDARVEPDLASVSAYLSTSRRELGGRTVYAGLNAVRPGEVLRVDLRAPFPEPRTVARRSGPPVDASFASDDHAAEATRAAVEDSLARHLVADVPVCTLLSGGLDSSILATLASEHAGELRSWCAGGVEDGAELGPDSVVARAVAARLGFDHAEVRLARDAFVSGWEALVEHLGTPLSTPNEVAIAAVARAVRAGGCAVALSGEGADELFAGYDAVLDSLAAGEGAPDPARLHLDTLAWVPIAVKEVVLSEAAFAEAEGDAWLLDAFAREYAECADEAGPDAAPLDVHLRLQRRVNLTGLLQRLDTATMLHSVEGRTPFADVAVARVAEALPVARKFAPLLDDGGAVATATATRSKRALRAAFAPRLPRAVLEREKAAFPLPFRRWAAELGPGLARSPFARSIFAPAVLAEVARDPAAHWRFAWPMLNVALWGDRIWS